MDNYQNIYSIFNINSFEQLDNALNDIAPSMCEYYLNDLISNLSSDTILNKSKIQSTVYIDFYSIHLDYDNNIFIEYENNNMEEQTASLW